MNLARRYATEHDHSIGPQGSHRVVDKNVVTDSAVHVDISRAGGSGITITAEREAPTEESSKWTRREVFCAWLLVCFSTGPTSSMTKVYIPAVIQSLAHAVGHQKNSTLKCLPTGDNCYVSFGAATVQYTYVLYLKAIYTALEGLVATLIMTVADYSNYRKWLLLASIVVFGVLACPFAALDSETTVSLITASVIYCLMLVIETIYQIIEGSYVPIFMFAATQKVTSTYYANGKGSIALERGSKVSALALIMGNLGGIVALIVGAIISYSVGRPNSTNVRNYLIAISSAGVMTVVVGGISVCFVPSLRGRQLVLDETEPLFAQLLKLPFCKLVEIFRDFWEYKEAMKFVVAWVLWNISFSNFLSVNGLMFRSTLGITTSNAEYTVWQLMANILALLGSLVWMLLYNFVGQKTSNSDNIKLVKKSLFSLLFFGWLANFWGALGASSQIFIGYKHRWEFWLGLILFMGTSSAIRAINRVLYSTMLPKEKENQFFGLEIMLGLLTGWSEPLLVAVISDRTGNSRMPYIPNTFLFTVAVGAYYWCDMETGMRRVGKL
ncbi:LADA_0B09758g1_1 [Lachancea dasiensis]|uniref:Autophagy-related protein n=1 Tax=Lachancea dasiensis TaxID=1072105 RepID=A0A1G4IV33_9SACH|nr:LADA_0B09758g1_1 [Lachancea dasiensis]